MRSASLYTGIVIMGLVLASCVEEFDLETVPQESHLVVRGLITDQPEPCEVRLSRSASYREESGIAYERNALVWIEDDLGNLYSTSQVYLQYWDTIDDEPVLQTVEKPGSYTTDPSSFRGEPGRKYRLLIELQNGQAYESSWEEMLPAQPIQQVSWTYETWEEISPNGVPLQKDGFQVHVSTAPLGSPGYYRWKCFGVYEVTTVCPDNENCLSRCFITDDVHNRRLYVAEDAAGSGIEEEPVAMIDNTLGTKYQVTIKQLTLTESAYRYWEMIRMQLEMTGTIFDPPPARVHGNLCNRMDPDEVVLGFFQVSPVTEKKLIIDRSQIKVPRFTVPYVGDCRELPHSSPDPPEGF